MGTGCTAEPGVDMRDTDRMNSPAGAPDEARAAAIAAASRRSLIGAAAYGLLAAAAGTASVEAAPSAVAGKAGVQVAPQTVESGRTVKVSGKGYPPKATGSIFWDATGQWLANVRTDRKGGFRTRVTIPTGLQAGSYRLSVRIWEVNKTARVEVKGPPPAPPVPTPKVGRAWGVFHPDVPQNPAALLPGDFGLLGKLTNNIGRTPGIVMWYQAWGLDATKGFNPALLGLVRDAGSVPMITWEPWNPWNAWDERYRPTQLLKGDHDGYIRSWAEGLKSYGGPVLLRWGHESNGFWYPWAGQWGAQPGDPPNETQASQYVRSWKRIQRIFREVYGGPTENIAWVWCPNIDFTGATPLSMIYPGADAVDWTGLDGYNWYSDPNSAWKSFGDIFEASLGILRSVAPGKPVIIGEVASHEDGQQLDRKADWIRTTFLEEIPQRHPEIRAFIWFDEDKERSWAVTQRDPGMAWDANYQANRIRSLAAFREVAASEFWDGVPLASPSSRTRRTRD